MNKHEEERLDSVMFKIEGADPYPTVEGRLTKYSTGPRFYRRHRYGVRFIIKFLLSGDMMVLHYNRQFTREQEARKDFGRIEQVWEWVKR